MIREFRRRVAAKIGIFLQYWYLLFEVSLPTGRLGHFAMSKQGACRVASIFGRSRIASLRGIPSGERAMQWRWWRNLLQAALSLLCAYLATMSIDFDGAEMAGGTITGPLITIQIVGLCLLFAASGLTFLAPRVAAMGALTGSFLCLPLFAYVVAPGFYRWLIPGSWSAGSESNLVWNGQAAAGIVATSVAALISVRTLLPVRAGSNARQFHKD